jgi:hypothetical protein
MNKSIDSTTPEKNSFPLCKDCKYYTIRRGHLCVRPIGSDTSLVTGDTKVIYSNNFCGEERIKVSRLLRLFGCDSCGEEGRHFLRNTASESVNLHENTGLLC